MAIRLRRFSLVLGVAVWFASSPVHAQSKHLQSKGPSQACASCHSSEALLQPRTPMGHSVFVPANDAILQSHAHMVLSRGGYTYTVETHGDVSTYTITDGVNTISMPILWGFGTHSQSWVVERNGRFHETLVTYYPEVGGLAPTTGDTHIIPTNLEEAIGPEESDSDSVACFGCHTTGAVSNGHLTLASMKPGVTCEHCHEGTLAHMADASIGKLDTVPPSLGAESSESLSKFCGQCHRTWETVVRNKWKGPVTVRFQPFRLANSKCFSGTDARISCVACHNPHENLTHGQSFYDGKCLACHAAAVQLTQKAGTRVAPACPVSTKDCVSCHMPKVKLPDATSTFTDHQIRIVRAGDVYPN